MESCYFANEVINMAMYSKRNKCYKNCNDYTKMHFIASAWSQFCHRQCKNYQKKKKTTTEQIWPVITVRLKADTFHVSLSFH